MVLISGVLLNQLSIKHKDILSIRHFRNEKGAGGKIHPAIVSFRIGHFTVMDGSEADGDLVLIQTSLLYYVNKVILMLTSSFQGQFP